MKNPLLAFVRPNINNMADITPEQLIQMAEKLGRVKIERHYSNVSYKAEIQFNNSNGSLIWAAGEDTNFFNAIGKAIQEAMRLK